MRMARLARGEDERTVKRRCSGALDLGRTTLPEDTADAATLAYALWPLCERVSARLKQGLPRWPDDHLEAQDRRLSLAHALPPAGRGDPAGGSLVSHRGGPARRRGRRHYRFRLIAVGADALVEDLAADQPTMFDRELDRPLRIEHSPQARRRSGAARRPPARRHRGAAKGIDGKRPRKWSAVRLNERLDVVQFSTDRVVAVVDQHVLRNSVVEKAHAELILWLFDAGIRREESEPDAPAGPLQ